MNGVSGTFEDLRRSPASIAVEMRAAHVEDTDNVTDPTQSRTSNQFVNRQCEQGSQKSDLPRMLQFHSLGCSLTNDKFYLMRFLHLNDTMKVELNYIFRNCVQFV